ncbi:MAG: aminoacyl-tRNA hydrolase [Deltaproteobacteria bacterium]|nr:aminoacyl-tRNA hydrolase [Deltaproteobacteria bacterium]
MWFVAGLGNPGREYEGTRHNVGFEVVSMLADRHRYPAARDTQGAKVAKGRIGREEVLLIQPQTYMNLSGDAIGAIVRFYKGEGSSLVVIHDELDFEPGVVRVKVGGGHGGHNGLRSIILHLGDAFVRVRVGIGKPPKDRPGADHVLSRFDGRTRAVMEKAVVTAADAVEAVVALGAPMAMGRFNRRSDAAVVAGAEAPEGREKKS